MFSTHTLAPSDDANPHHLGTNDIVIPSGHVTAAACLKNGKLVMIAGGGHLSHIERPDMFVAAFEQFLVEQGKAREGGCKQGRRAGEQEG